MPAEPEGSRDRSCGDSEIVEESLIFPTAHWDEMGRVLKRWKERPKLFAVALYAVCKEFNRLFHNMGPGEHGAPISAVGTDPEVYRDRIKEDDAHQFLDRLTRFRKIEYDATPDLVEMYPEIGEIPRDLLFRVVESFHRFLNIQNDSQAFEDLRQAVDKYRRAVRPIVMRINSWNEEPGVECSEVPSDPESEAEGRPRQTANERMLQMLDDARNGRSEHTFDELLGWTIRRWCEELGFAESTVHGTDAWNSIREELERRRTEMQERAFNTNQTDIG